MTEYVFSALDLGCLCLINEVALPELVSDPFGRASKKKVKKLLDEFVAAQQQAGLLTVNDGKVTLEENLAKSLAPIYEGLFAVKHKTIPTLVLGTGFYKIIYASDTAGLTLLAKERGQYRLNWYPSPRDCYPDFIEGFGFGNVGPYPGEPFKICGDAAIIDKLIGDSQNPLKKKSVAEYAKNNGMEASRLKSIIKSVMREQGKMVFLNVGRSETVKHGAIAVKLVLKEQHMMKMIFSPDGDLITLESFSNLGLWDQIISFEGK
ncbi:MAG: hypothetical protein LBB91_08525 [Clostridiales bacterium]|jgi:hypothetical protein|nr:hypothetical protein [Clostridiales bacterium]